MQKALTFALMMLAAYSAPACSTSMIEPPRTGMSLSFENGDHLQIMCGPTGESCQLSLTVNGKHFQFGSKDLDNLEILAEHAHLYSGPFSGREKYFSFEVSVMCPEGDNPSPPHECYANVLVQEDEAPDVTVIRRTTSYVP